MIQTIPLKNKPVCAVYHEEAVYVGDARGNVFRLSHPFIRPELLHSVHAPVSSIVVLGQDIYYGTWDGTIHRGDCSRKLGVDMIKCIAYWKGRLLVSMGMSLIVLGLELETVKEYPLPAKAYSMGVTERGVLLGMGHGISGAYNQTLQIFPPQGHSASILAIKDCLSGDSYGKLLKGSQEIYRSDGWIRSIWSERLFSSGKNVIHDSSILYSHDDEVIAVLQIGELILSFGLDYCYKIYSPTLVMDEGEEQALMEMLLL